MRNKKRMIITIYRSERRAQRPDIECRALPASRASRAGEFAGRGAIMQDQDQIILQQIADIGWYFPIFLFGFVIAPFNTQ